MQCIYPSEIKVKGLEQEKIQVPCGVCRKCRIHRKQAWIGRLRMEAAAHTLKCFTTLTYSDDKVKDLNYADVQAFLALYRRRRPGQRIRFFCVGEYGKRTARPHWHLCLFGTVCPPEMVEWPYGFTHTGELNTKSIGYVAGYSLKDSARPEVVVRCSNRPGIGMDQLFLYGRRLARVRDRMDYVPNSITIGGRRYPLHATAYRRLLEGFEYEGGVRHEKSLYSCALEHDVKKRLCNGNPEMAENYLGSSRASSQGQIRDMNGNGTKEKKL